MPNTKSNLTGLHMPSLVFSFMYNKTTQKSEWFYFCSFITQSHFPKMFEHCIKQNKSKSYTFKLSLIHMYKDNIFNVKTDTFQKRKCSILNLSLGFAGPCFKFSFKILCHIPTFLEMGLFNIVKQDISPQNLKKSTEMCQILIPQTHSGNETGLYNHTRHHVPILCVRIYRSRNVQQITSAVFKISLSLYGDLWNKVSFKHDLRHIRSFIHRWALQAPWRYFAQKKRLMTEKDAVTKGGERRRTLLRRSP